MTQKIKTTDRELLELAAKAAVIEKLREALSVVMWFVPNHPTVPENKRRFDILKAALAIPTDSTQILEQYVKEKTQAQAAVIEKLAKRVASTNIILEVVCNIHPESVCARYELAENKNALAIPTDSTKILDEVRRAEREKCAKVCESHPDPEYTAVHFECARLIRALE